MTVDPLLTSDEPEQASDFAELVVQFGLVEKSALWSPDPADWRPFAIAVDRAVKALDARVIDAGVVTAALVSSDGLVQSVAERISEEPDLLPADELHTALALVTLSEWRHRYADHDERVRPLRLYSWLRRHAASNRSIRVFEGAPSLVMAAIHSPTTDIIKSAFVLSDAEIAKLFGVTRQAVAKWSRSGVPADHHAKLATAASIADILRRRIKADRVSAVVRRPAAAYGDKSILQMIEENRQDEVLRRVRESFDYHRAAA